MTPSILEPARNRPGSQKRKEHDLPREVRHPFFRLTDVKVRWRRAFPEVTMKDQGRTHRLQRTTPRRSKVPAPWPTDQPEPHSAAAPKRRILDRVRDEIRTRHYSPRTEKAYVFWIKRFIFFHDKRHPDTMGEAEISAFVSQLATRRNASASTQGQALSALLFLYRHVLRRELNKLKFARAKRPTRLPLVLTRREVNAVLDRMTGTTALMALLLYGSGLRVRECCRLRVKDLNLERREITVRDGKGEKDRITMVPESLVKPLHAQLKRVRAQHERDILNGSGFVELPYALDKKYPNAPREWGWQWVFPQPGSTSTAKPTGAVDISCTRAPCNARSRTPCSPPESRNPQAATLSDIPSRDPPPRRRLRHPHHSGATGTQRRHYDNDLCHVLNRGGRGVRSPLDKR